MVPAGDSGPVVLLVEDDGAVRSALRRLLQHEALPAIGAASLGEARTAMRESAASLRVVVVDLGLGAEDGFDLVEEIHHAASGLRVVVFSAQDESVSPERFLRAGVHDVLSKPADPSAIVAAVRRALGEGAEGKAGEWSRTHPSRGEHRAS